MALKHEGHFFSSGFHISFSPHLVIYAIKYRHVPSSHCTQRHLKKIKVSSGFWLLSSHTAPLCVFDNLAFGNLRGWKRPIFFFFFWEANFHILRWIQNSREPLQQLQGTLLTFFFKCFKPISCAQDGVVSRKICYRALQMAKWEKFFFTSMLKTCLSVTSWSMRWHLIAECVRVIFLFFSGTMFDFYSKAFHLQVLI